ncbi:MAG: N-acetyl-alpha-D-glucosaminyl L-malate synthase BshA [Planctomycetota bacterium]|jgi:N-acetyl-alpha-D-glucosaminyl L-malate synthase BshA
MKIGMVCYPTYGGSGVVATELGMELGQRGHEIHFISYQPPARFDRRVENLSFHEVEMSTYPVFKHPPYLLALASKMAEVACSTGLDLFHVHYALPHTISASLARAILEKPDLPVVTTLHGTDITIIGREPAYAPVVRFALKDSDGVTAVSESLAEETRAAFGFEGEIFVIPNFVDADRFQPEAPCELKERFAPEGEKLLIHVSNFRPVKNAGNTVRILAEVAKRMNVRLLLVGDGPERSSVRALAEELGVAGRVQFLGETPEVARVLACADLFLLPSSKESFGLAALEAMAAGLPVIASRAGGIPEVVVDGVSGRLFEPHDVGSMAAASVELLADEVRMQGMAREARDRAVNRFAPERIVPEYEAVYEKMLLKQGTGKGIGD